MKPTIFFAIVLSFVLSNSSFADVPSKVLIAKVDAAKIAQVKAGKLKEAHASWWGFDKNDATEALQSAINSGVPKLVVDNMGSKWIVNKTIHLVSNQKIYFGDGVVVEAMRGKFEGKKDSLFQAQDVHDVVMEGHGNVVFRMQKADYDNPKLYAKAEWRHGIALYNCKNVTLRNLTVTKTGGDGLYLGDKKGGGYNQNVWVEKMNFDDNYRQGVSVISAQNLTIKDSRLANTSGTAPQAGIDFEPNNPKQRLVNCVLDNCVFEGNAAAGVIFFSRNLSKPITITVKNSAFKKNSGGVSARFSTDTDKQGKVLLENCTFDHQNINIRNPMAQSIPYVFKNCMMDFRGDTDSLTASNAPIALTVDTDEMDQIVGGVTLDNITILADKYIAPLGFNVHNGGFGFPKLITSDIEGIMHVKVNGKKTTVTLPALVAAAQQELKEADPVNAIVDKYSKTLIDNISKEWHFLPDPAEGIDITSPQFDDSSWKVIDGGYRQWWQKQGIKYNGTAWYRKNVTIPDLSSDQKVTLYFNGIDGSTRVYVNGKKVGEHILKGSIGWDAPFHFDVTNFVSKGKNLIAIQVSSKDKFSASGINEDVYLVTGVPR